MASAPILARPRRSVQASRRPILQYFILACIFLTGVAFQYRQSIDIIHGEKIDVAYFAPDTASAILSVVPPDAQKAGMHRGDLLLAINGRAYTGSAVLAEEVIRATPGSPVRVRLRSTDPRIGEYEVLLPVTPGASGPLKIVFDVLLDIFMPAFCLLLGSWVVLVRPHDKSSWLLLGLLLGFSHLSSTGRIPGWGPGFRELAIGYDIALASCWPIFMFLFGFYFPEPFPFWAKAGWLKKSILWIAIAPLVVNAIINVVILIHDVNDYQAAHAVLGRFGFFQTAIRIYTYAVVS
jgi:sigma-B regulation protein RsbU (phosphoserine phosphatase)